MTSWRPTVTDFTKPLTDQQAVPSTPPQALQPQASSGVSPEQQERLLNLKDGVYDRAFADAIVVQVTPEGKDAFAELDADARRSITVIQGMFFKVGEHRGSPVFRQERSQGANDLRLFCYKVLRLIVRLIASSLFILSSSILLIYCQVESGWYFTTAFMANLHDVAIQPKKKAKLGNEQDVPEIFAWAAPTELLPTSVHCPYWARKKSGGIIVRTLVEELLKAAELPKEPAPPTPQLAPDDTEQGKGKGKGKSKAGGGWMNKAVQLMAAVFDGRWDDCTEMSAEFLTQNETARDLVSRTNCVCVVKHICWKRLYADRCCRSKSFELAVHMHHCLSS